MQQDNNGKPLGISIDCVIFGFDDSKLKVLLIEQTQQREDHIPLMALPGDLVYEGEDLDSAAHRVLYELTGIDDIFLEQFKAFGNPDRLKHPKDQLWLQLVRQNPKQQVITIGYYSLVRMEDYSPQGGKFAKQSYWIDIDELPDLAFDHSEIFREALRKLRESVQNDLISFELMPKKFTLVQLHLLYEIILNKELDKRNFRKKIKRIEGLIPLDEKQKGSYHKPAQLFSFQRKEESNSSL